MSISPARTHLRLWVLMVGAFALLGLCTTFGISSFLIGNLTQDARANLLSQAKLIALQFKPEDQSRLSRSDTALYKELTGALVKVERQVPSLRRVYAIRRIRGVYENTLDSTLAAPGGAVPAALLIPTPSPSRMVKDVFDSGVADADEEIVTDRVGPFFSAYAPLVDRTGHVLAVLGVDGDAREITAHVHAIERASTFGAIAVIILGALFSVIVVRQLVRSSRTEAWLRGASSSKGVFRATLLELGLAGSACAVMGLGAYGQIQMGQLKADETTSLNRSAALEQYRSSIISLLKDDKRKVATLRILSTSAEADGLVWVSGILQSAAEGPEKDWKEPLWQSLIAIKKKATQELSARNQIRLDTEFVNSNLNSTFVLAVFLAFGALILVRSAMRQQQELMIARHDSQRHQVAYEQVATNLPIGFFTYDEGLIESSNSAWDTLVTRLPGEDRMMALERVVHDEDLDMLKTAFKSAEANGEAFHLQFRVHYASDEIRHYETRGVWVRMEEEGIDNLLGFFVDVTSLVQTSQELELRNREIQAKNMLLSKALTDLEENFEAMVRSLVKAVEAKDKYTAGHSERVMQYSLRIGEALGISAQDLRILQRGTLIHDIGKIGIPDAVLMKPDKLTDDEFRVIQTHPTIGATMVRGIPVFEDCIPIILYHHERLDGTGYPMGLAGDEIPLLVRIASVADVFDALTSTRAYRSAMDIDRAITILRNDVEKGILDGKIVDVLADIVLRDGVLWRTALDEAA